jgi:hypothetical protein
VLASAEEIMKRRYALRSGGPDLLRVAFRVSEALDVEPEEVPTNGRYRRIEETRSLLYHWAVRELEVPMPSLDRKLVISIPSVSEFVNRGLRIPEGKISLLKT